jgi:hypothetical protein
MAGDALFTLIPPIKILGFWGNGNGFSTVIHQGMRRDECSGYLQHLIDHYEERSMAFHGRDIISSDLKNLELNGLVQGIFLTGLRRLSPIYISWENLYGFRLRISLKPIHWWTFSDKFLLPESEEPADYTLFFQADAADHLHWGYLSLVPCSRNQCNSPNNECPSKSCFVFAIISCPYLGSWNNLDP